MVYGVEGRKLKSVPRYTDDVLDAVKIFSMFADREVKTTEFGFKLLARSHNYSSADTDTMVQFVRMNQLDDNLMTAIHEFIDAGGRIEFEITPNTSSYSNYIVWDCREDIETDFEGKTICFHINE